MHGKLGNFSPQYCLTLCFLIYTLLCYLISWLFPQISGVSWWMHKTYSFYDTNLFLVELVQEKVSKTTAPLISQYICLFVLKVPKLVILQLTTHGLSGSPLQTTLSLIFKSLFLPLYGLSLPSKENDPIKVKVGSCCSCTQYHIAVLLSHSHQRQSLCPLSYQNSWLQITAGSSSSVLLGSICWTQDPLLYCSASASGSLQCILAYWVHLICCFSHVLILTSFSQSFLYSFFPSHYISSHLSLFSLLFTTTLLDIHIFLQA